jgi:hypothetical protein
MTPNKYQPKNLTLEKFASPFEPEGPRSHPTLRTDSKPCSICGKAENCSGLNAYVKLQHKFGGSSSNPGFGYYRYLGVFRVRFCEECVPPSEVSAARDKSRRLASRSRNIALAVLALDILFMCKLDFENPSGAGALVDLLSVLVLIGGALTVLLSIMNTSLRKDPIHYAWEYYEKETLKILKQYKYELFDKLDLRAYAIKVEGARHYESTLEHLKFEVEPVPFREGRTPYVVTGENGVQWVGWGTTDALSHNKGR